MYRNMYTFIKRKNKETQHHITTFYVNNNLALITIFEGI